MTARIQRYSEYFENLTPQALDDLASVLTADARFKDPFNDVIGLPAIRRIFEHMYRETDRPRFRVLGASEAGDVGYLHWELEYAFRRRPKRRLRIVGMSRLEFVEDGRVTEHVDYWDPLEGLLTHLPLVGGLFRLPQRLLRTPQE